MPRRVPYKMGMHAPSTSNPPPGVAVSDLGKVIPNEEHLSPDEGDLSPKTGVSDPKTGTPIPETGGTGLARVAKSALRSKKPNARTCRCCGSALTTHAEYALGVHIGCVSDAKFRKKPIPGPGYGFQR